MPVRERESGELPSPICPGLTERLNRDLLFYPIILPLILILINQNGWMRTSMRMRPITKDLPLFASKPTVCRHRIRSRHFIQTGEFVPWTKNELSSVLGVIY